MSNIPKVVFIIPYRNRPQHKYFFSNYFKTIMDNSDLKNNYEIYFSHQTDTKSFNRGATKNIGFLAIKEKYPNDYKNITFVFNDIDTIPFSNIFLYKTDMGIVKHFYGFDYALGGIVALNGNDFENINGYPNFWGWGLEVSVLQKRCIKHGLEIDRSQFFSIGDPHILHLFDGIHRIINRKDNLRSSNDNGYDGLKTIRKLEYSIDTESTNVLDNIHTIEADNIFIINIKTFVTATKFENEKYHKYDLREPTNDMNNLKPIIEQDDYINNNWTNIPFYPTFEKKKEMIQKYGKQTAENIIKYSYNNTIDPTKETLPPILFPSKHVPSKLVPSTKLEQMQLKPVNIFSQEYARLKGIKPKATKSANIRLGGLYK